MKIMLIKGAVALLVLPLLVQAEARNPFSGKATVNTTVEGTFSPVKQIPPSIKDPRAQFVDPLTVYMRTVWPDDVKTVRQAIDYLLEPTGYQLVTSYPAPREAALLVNRPIPPIAYVHRTIPVLDALQLLVGLDNYVVVDHAHQLISFQRSR
ncbi:hypothetical protein L580_3306 [Serratia fonticola AU-P3(3)]|nr:hypothetical protein L580_3306 [Serratia fonticola AU-P3(3)]